MADRIRVVRSGESLQNDPKPGDCFTVAWNPTSAWRLTGPKDLNHEYWRYVKIVAYGRQISPPVECSPHPIEDKWERCTIVEDDDPNGL